MQDFRVAALSATLDQLQTDVILLLENSEVLHANCIAAELLDKKSVIRVCRGYLMGKDKKTTTTIRNAIAALASLREGSNILENAVQICLERASDETDAVVGTLRLLVGHNFEKPVVALFISKRESGMHFNLAGFAETYNLTKAETRTLEHVACGLSASQAAGAETEYAVSKNTIKTHLQHIFEKTGTSRQIELLRLIYAFRPPLRTPVRTYLI